MVKDKIFHPGNLYEDACTFYGFKNQLVPLQVLGLKRFTARVSMVPFRVLNHEIVWQEISDNWLIIFSRLHNANKKRSLYMYLGFLCKISDGYPHPFYNVHESTPRINFFYFVLFNEKWYKNYYHCTLSSVTARSHDIQKKLFLNTLLVLQMTLLICNIPTSLPLMALFYFLRNKIN